MSKTLLVDLLGCCRICLGDISSENIGIYIEDSLRESFKELTGIELIDDPNTYSNIICEHCNDKIAEFGQFKNELILVQQNLYNCQEEILYEEIIDESPIECDVKDIEVSIINEVSLLQPKTERNERSCFVCAEPVASNSYYQHLKRVHKIGRSFECDHCGKKFQLKYDLTVHMRKHLDRNVRQKFPCEYCNSTLLSKGSLSNHVKTFHSDIIEIHPCDINDCESVFQTRMKLLQHKKNVHEGGSYPCDSCEKSFSNRQYLQKHIKQCHTAIEFETCEICGKYVRRGTQLKQHMLSHSGKLFECSYEGCDKKFQFKGSLSKHIQNCHRESEPVECSYCTYVFPSVRHLNRHISRQHNEIKVQCEVEGCCQLFGRKDYLASHYKNHKDIDENTRRILLERVKSIKEISW